MNETDEVTLENVDEEFRNIKAMATNYCQELSKPVMRAIVFAGNFEFFRNKNHYLKYIIIARNNNISLRTKVYWLLY